MKRAPLTGHDGPYLSELLLSEQHEVSGQTRVVDLLNGDPAEAREQLARVPDVGFDELVRTTVDNDLAQQEQLTSR